MTSDDASFGAIADMLGDPTFGMPKCSASRLHLDWQPTLPHQSALIHSCQHARQEPEHLNKGVSSHRTE